MAVVIELPHVGESVVEGVIGKWLAHPGDQLRRFDPLVEVVTDKVTMEVPSPYDGVLISVLAQEGETVPMGAPIAEMDTGDASPERPVAQSTQPAAPPVQPASATPPSTIGYLSRDLQPVGPTGGVMYGSEAPPADTVPVVSPEPDEAGERRRYSPAVRRLARDHDIDPDSLSGSGMGGRVTREDVMRAVETRGATAGAAPAPTHTAAPAPT